MTSSRHSTVFSAYLKDDGDYVDVNTGLHNNKYMDDSYTGIATMVVGPIEETTRLVVDTIKGNIGGMTRMQVIRTLKQGGLKPKASSPDVVLIEMLSQYYFNQRSIDVNASKVIKDARLADELMV